MSVSVGAGLQGFSSSESAPMCARHPSSAPTLAPDGPALAASPGA